MNLAGAVTLARAFYTAAGLLVALLLLEWLPGGALPPVPAARIPHVAQAGDAGDQKDTDSWADAILQRPLFTVGRRPPRSSGSTRVAASGSLPRLSGIMITPFGRRAIFMPDGGKPLTLAEGASLDDSTIRQIALDRVVLVGPKGETVLRPSYDKQGRGQTTTQPSFTPPGFNPGFPNPNFNPAFNAPPGFPQPQPNQGDDANDNTPAVAPPLPIPPQFPGFRGPMVPRGRE